MKLNFDECNHMCGGRGGFIPTSTKETFRCLSETIKRQFWTNMKFQDGNFTIDGEVLPYTSDIKIEPLDGKSYEADKEYCVEQTARMRQFAVRVVNCSGGQGRACVCQQSKRPKIIVSNPTR